MGRSRERLKTQDEGMNDIKVPADAKKDEWDQSAGGSFDSSCDTPFTYQGKGNFLPFGFFLCEMECMVLKEKVQALFSF